MGDTEVLMSDKVVQELMGEQVEIKTYTSNCFDFEPILPRTLSLKLISPESKTNLP